MPQESEDFAEVIAKAQRLSGDMGNVFGDGNGPGRFAFEQRGHRGAGPVMDFDAHSEVFALPADRNEYEAVMNQVMRGEAVMRYEDRTFDKEGNFLVALVYLTPRINAAPPNDRDAGDAEPVERPRRMP